MIWTCQGPDGRIRSRFCGLLDPLCQSPSSAPGAGMAPLPPSLSRARTLQNCASPRNPMPSPTGIGYHSILVPLHALPNRAPNDSPLFCLSCSRRHREELKVRYRRNCRLKAGAAEEFTWTYILVYASGALQALRRKRQESPTLEAIALSLALSRLHPLASHRVVDVCRRSSGTEEYHLVPTRTVVTVRRCQAFILGYRYYY